MGGFSPLVRWRIGPYYKPRKTVDDESLAEMGFGLWGIGQPLPVENWAYVQMGNGHPTILPPETF